MLFAILTTNATTAQSVGIGTTAPDASAQLDVTSNDKGVLIPRMTQALRDAIGTPATGLLIYQTDNTPGFYYYNGSAWTAIAGSGGTGWLLTGNSGTNPATDFVGTTDNLPLNFRINNTRAGFLGTNGNIFWGQGSGNNNTGYSNIAIGKDALFSNNTAHELVAIGDSALYFNTAIFNTAVGSKALFNNTNGVDNTAIGTQALYSNITGNNNTANGSHTLYNNTGESNTAIGSAALFSNITGSFNMASGNAALYGNINGNYNTAVVSAALFANLGNNNTAVGYNVLQNNTTGVDNTSIGFEADVSTGSLNNATAVGSGAIVNVSNKVRIGNGLVTVIEGQVAWSFPSDARFKYNIKNNVPGLDFITKLKPVTYFFDTEKLDTYTKTGIIDNSIIHPVNYSVEQELHTGFLAQDVEKIADELGYQFDGIHKPTNDRDHYSLAYSQFIMPLVKAVQEQQEMIEDQWEMIKELEKDIQLLKDNK